MRIEKITWFSGDGKHVKLVLYGDDDMGWRAYGIPTDKVDNERFIQGFAIALAMEYRNRVERKPIVEEIA